MHFQLIAFAAVGLATTPSIRTFEQVDSEVHMAHPVFEEVDDLVSATLHRLRERVGEDVLTEWENLNGPQLQAIVDDESRPTDDRNSAFRVALSAMGMLLDPSIPADELAERVGFSHICSESNLARIRFEDGDDREDFVKFRTDMFERRERSASVASLTGVAELGSLCPDVTRGFIELRGLILVCRAIRAIPRHWRNVHITVNAVSAFHDSRSLLLGPEAVLFDGRFSITTKTSAGSSDEIHDWFVAVNNELSAHSVGDKALGRFLALCVLHGEPSVFHISREFASSLVGRSNILHGSAELQLDETGLPPMLVSGFHDIISRDMLTDVMPEELISMLRNGAPKLEPAIPFLPSVSDNAPRSDLAAYISEAMQTQYFNSAVVARISNYLQQAPNSDNPLEKWKKANGPELLQLTYSLLTRESRYWSRKVDALKGLMMLVADSGADTAETGIEAFCRTHQFELEELLVGSILTDGIIERVLFSYPASRREELARSFFAADWFTQCPSVLASNYLKGIALSHLVFREIVLSSDRIAIAQGLMRMAPETYYEGDEQLPAKADLLGRQIGWYIVDQISKSVPRIPLEVYQDVLSGNGPVAAGLAAVISPALIARFPSLGISPAVLQDIVSLNPARVLTPSSQVPEGLQNIIPQAYVGPQSSMRVIGVWELCLTIVRAAQREHGDYRILSGEIGLNKLCMDRPALCRSVIENEFSKPSGMVNAVLPELPSLFPEFWAATRANIILKNFRLRLDKAVARARSARIGIKKIAVRRNHVLEDSWYWLTEGHIGSQLRLSDATFESELGEGPGVFADWFSLLAFQLGKKVLHLRNEMPQFYVPNSEASRVELVALGRLLGLALVLQNPIPLGLPLMLFAGLLPKYSDYTAALMKDDPAVFASYQKILGLDENALREAEIVINSIVVTVANRHQLINEAIRGPFQGIAMGAISSGFSDIVPAHAFLHTGITSPSELQLLIQGASDVDVADMQTHVKLDDEYTSLDDQIVWLFAFLEASDLETRRKFLHFLTGLSAVGVGGFAQNPIFIQYASGDDNRLPTAHTCGRTLDLPKYTSRAILEEKLTIAINADSGMGIL